MAEAITGRLIADAGFVPVHLGELRGSAVLDPPRRDGAVHGEEYRGRISKWRARRAPARPRPP